MFYASGKCAKPCAEGSHQGTAEAGIAASAAIQEPHESADEALATACEGFAHTDFNDMYLCGEPAAVAQALADFETVIALIGATLQHHAAYDLRDTSNCVICTRRRSCKGAGRINTPGLKPDGQISLSQNFF